MCADQDGEAERTYGVNEPGADTYGDRSGRMGALLTSKSIKTDARSLKNKNLKNSSSAVQLSRGDPNGLVPGDNGNFMQMAHTLNALPPGGSRYLVMFNSLHPSSHFPLTSSKQ